MTGRRLLVAASLAVLLAACSGSDVAPQPGTATIAPTVAPSEPSPVAPTTTATPTSTPTLATPAVADASGGVDLAYGDHPLQRLDLFLPDGPGPHPLFFWLHGGGWIVGDKAELPFRDLVDQGVAVASANHRGALDDYPDLFEDPGLALTWVLDRADDFAIDADRVVIGGFSAGAHLAALTTLTSDIEVAGMIGFAGPYDLLDITNIPDSAGVGAALLALMLDCPIDQCPDRLAAISPLAQVRAASVPTYLQAGSADELVDARSTRAYADALGSVGTSVEVEIIDGGSHRVVRTDGVDAFLQTVFAA